MLLLAADLVSMRGLDIAGRWWMLPGVLLLSSFALVSPRWPVPAAVGAALVLVVWSAVMRLVGAEVLDIFGHLLASEAGAVALVILVVVRRVEGVTAAGLVVLVLAGCAAAQALRIRYGSPSAGSLSDAVLPGLFVLLLAVVAGRYLRGRDREQARATRAAVAAAQQRERLSVARDLHDVVAHHVGAMVVQAQAAQVVAETDPKVGTRVLPTIEASGRDALDAMRRLVTTLRDSDADDPGRGVPPIQTADLVADLRAVTAVPAGGGTAVGLTVELAEPVPAEVATSVLRLVQEATTNARRHATDARGISVSVRASDGVVRVKVIDDGRVPGRPRSVGGGYGLVGMRERVQLLGGQFSAGRMPDGGWQVAADVPLRV
jgi:signal transduction histidine kinase